MGARIGRCMTVPAFVLEREDQEAAVHDRVLQFLRSSLNAKVKKAAILAALLTRTKTPWRK
jgi:ribosomal protein L14